MRLEHPRSSNQERIPLCRDRNGKGTGGGVCLHLLPSPLWQHIVDAPAQGPTASASEQAQEPNVLSISRQPSMPPAPLGEHPPFSLDAVWSKAPRPEGGLCTNSDGSRGEGVTTFQQPPAARPWAARESASAWRPSGFRAPGSDGRPFSARGACV